MVAGSRPWGFACSDLKAPVALFYGEDDPTVGPEHGHWWARTLPRGELGVRARLRAPGPLRGVGRHPDGGDAMNNLLESTGVGEHARRTATCAVRLPCQHLDPRWWFSDRPAELELAKDHCRQCPMQSPCLVGALARREPCGVWGGQIFDNGVTIEQKRPRGRPRKYPDGTGRAAKHPRPRDSPLTSVPNLPRNG